MGNRVLSIGVNRHRASPLVVTNPKTESSFHAEIVALRRIKNVDSLKGATMYVARANGLNSMPCANCQAELSRMGIEWVA